MDSLRENEYANSVNKNNSDHIQSLIFPNRFKSIPLIFSTCFWLSENYHKIKQTNSLTKKTCDLAETTLKNSFELATPLLSKFRNQVGFVDAVACNQLDKMLAAFTLISNDTNNIYSQTKQFIYELKSQPCNQTRNLFGKMLDLSEKFIESNLIYNELLLEAEASDNQATFNYNQELIKTYKNQKDLFKNDLSHRTKILTLITYNSIQYKLLNQLNESFKLFREYLLNLFKIIETFKAMKEALALNVKDKFHVTKDKIDLYKEYLDVLSKQFTVQDGRSLDHIHSLEERTKIIIRRSIGNLLTAFHIIHSRVKHLDPMIQQKFNSIRHFLVNLYHIYDKNDGALVNDILVESIINESKECLNRIQMAINNSIRKMNESTGNLDWLVPNFGAFGVLDEDDDDQEEDLVHDDNELNLMNGGQLINRSHSFDAINNQMLNELTHRNHRLI